MTVGLSRSQKKSFEMIRQAILDDNAGNMTACFEDATMRLAILCEGVSWGSIRVPHGESMKAPKARMEPLDVDSTTAPHG
jgi:hypothetical protein